MKIALRVTTVAAIGLVIQMTVTQISAFTSFGKWSSGQVVYYFNPQNNDVSEAAAEAALLVGMNAWNNQGGSFFRYIYGGRVSDTSLSNDGRNVVLFRNEFSPDAIATTYTWRIGTTIIDADIIFWDGTFKFITEGDACSNSAYIEDVATHEFGHGLGLGHSTDPASTMWPTYAWCSRQSRTLAPDDVAGIQSLYGVDSSANIAPTVAITSPVSGSYPVSRAITFSGWASDPQDGDLASALQWTSSIDGVIGSGPSFARTLSLGTHTITASVSDSGGLSGSMSVNIAVTAGCLLCAPGSASFVGVDTQTGGNWQGVYGAHGYQLANDGAALPPNLFVNRVGANTWTWAASTSDPRALQQVASSDRIAATWFGNFDTRLTFNDTVKHRVAIYVLDWDHKGRSQTIQILNSASLTVLDQRTVSAFDSGQYLVWDVQGAVTIRIVSDAGPNAVYSALFIDPVSTSPPPSSAATFVATDLGAQGTWKSTYGADGYSLANDGTSVPSYVTVNRTGGAAWTWSPSTTDVRALEKVAGGDRIAATWFGDFDTELNFTDTSSHRVAVYFVDFDYRGRSQTVQILDTATSAVLDERTLGDFAGGVYFVWDLKGAVTLRVRRTGGPNAVYSALFFDPVAASPPPSSSATFVTTDFGTQGTWKSSYGADGYSIANDGISIPAYVTVNRTGGAPWTWSASTDDARALEKVASSDRIAATWFGDFDTELNFTDPNSHRVAVYFVDFDNRGRAQTVQILDTATLAVLDQRTLSDFGGGVYLVWDLKGAVTLRIGRTDGPNAVYSALFF